jgi:type I restriction enzyme M protein
MTPSKFEGFNDTIRFIWSVADLLRGDYEADEYGQVILPLTVLRRLDCVLEPTKDSVVAIAKGQVGNIGNINDIDPTRLWAGQPFYNASPLTFARLLGDAPNIAANLRTYIAGYSTGAVEVLDKYSFDNQITRLDNAGLLYHVISHFAEIDLHPNPVSNQVMRYVFEAASWTPTVTSSISLPKSVGNVRVPRCVVTRRGQRSGLRLLRSTSGTQGG